MTIHTLLINYYFNNNPIAMKNQLLLIVLTFSIVLNSQAQVTRDLNTGFSADYVGWDVNQTFPLTIKHEAPMQPINFHTSAGAMTEIQRDVVYEVTVNNFNFRYSDYFQLPCLEFFSFVFFSCPAFISIQLRR